MKHRRHREHHRSGETGWLRAAVLGSNDAIVSTASLMIGVAAAEASREAILVAGTAGLVAGAMSMAVGEYVSVGAQRDAEDSDVARERAELAADPEAELHELTSIYQKRGLDKELALKVAEQLSARDGLGAHLRDELGIDPRSRARPVQAAVTSAIAFAVFAMLPLLGVLAAPSRLRVVAIFGVAVASLAVLGALGARLGGASAPRAVARVTLGGILAMAATAGVGHLLGLAL
ncbi:MAG: VIT family protein [Deltaproteobacteria bacterium]|nr:VIT family protein [Deltaproteobacteria bacterium]